MARSFDELRKQMSPERRKKNQEKAESILERLPLYELRNARKLSQAQLAEAMNVNQASISKLEHRVDIYISTLRRYIEAMGGTLVIRATFPDGEIAIDQFHSLENEDGELTY